MSGAASIFTAAIPDPVRILGVPLLPLSLGRYRLLRRFGCAFVADGPAQATMEDLIIGILICSMPCADFLAFIESPKSKRALAKWGRRIAREIRADPHFNVFAKFGLFQAYLSEAEKIPPYWDEADPSPPAGGHWSQAVEVCLRSELGYTRDEIEEAPLAKCISDYFAHAQAKGAIRLISTDELEQAALNDALFARLGALKPLQEATEETEKAKFSVPSVSSCSTPEAQCRA